MGSSALQRSGHRVHRLRRARPRGLRPGGGPEDYGYGRLARRPAGRARRPRDRPRRARRRLDGRAHADRVRARTTPSAWPALVVLTPAFDPEDDRASDFDRWDRSPPACASGGVEGFVEAYGDAERARAVARDDRPRARSSGLSAHAHPEALADALQRRAALAPVRGLGGPARDRGADRRRRLAATRPTPSTRTRSASATRRRSPAPGWCPRSPAARRSPGRARRSRA